MNFTWLEDFLALAATGNFSRAAQDRHVTQPAFSRRVRALEEWLGVDLFDRSGQPARLTPAGVWFEDMARELLARVDRLPGEARRVAQEDVTTLRFASTHALSFTFLPAWLRGLESRTPVGPVQLVSDVLPRCEALLQQRKVHFVLAHGHAAVPGPLDTSASPFAVVGTDSLLPVSAPDSTGQPLHPLDRGSAVPLLAYSAESGLGRILAAVHGDALGRVPGQAVFTAHLASVLKTMALDGRGVAWLPAMLISDALAAGQLVEAGTPRWRVDLEVRLLRDPQPLAQAAERFWLAATSPSP